MQKRMRTFLIIRTGDMAIANEYYEIYKGKSKQEMVDFYNRQVDCGITGVRRQAICLFAVNRLFKERFGMSPILCEDNLFISLTGKIKMVDETYIHLDNFNLN